MCGNIEEVRVAVPLAKAESSDGGVIIERYMADNQDLTISYIVKNGVPTLVSLGDRYPGRVEDNLDRQLSCTIQPSRYTEMYMQNVDQRVKDMIVHLGIQNGAVFMQGFVDGDTVRMYDPGIRFPGNEYERIHAKATGYNLMKSLITCALCGEVDDFDGKLEGTYDLNGMVAIQYMINVGAGQIATFEGFSEIEKLPFVIDIQQRHFVGDVIENTGDIKHRAGEISILVERDTGKMKEAIETVQSKLRVLDKDGNDMLISPFGSNRLDLLYANWGDNV